MMWPTMFTFVHLRPATLSRPASRRARLLWPAPANNRYIINGVLWRLRTAAPWRDVV